MRCPFPFTKILGTIYELWVGGLSVVRVVLGLVPQVQIFGLQYHNTTSNKFCLM